jgi:hypothetical protein
VATATRWDQIDWTQATKELGKARAMANILASQSAAMRAKGEALIQQSDRLCESWNERMWEASNRTPSLAAFTTTTAELKFSIHTGLPSAVPRSGRDPSDVRAAERTRK